MKKKLDIDMKVINSVRFNGGEKEPRKLRKN